MQNTLHYPSTSFRTPPTLHTTQHTSHNTSHLCTSHLTPFHPHSPQSPTSQLHTPHSTLPLTKHGSAARSAQRYGGRLPNYRAGDRAALRALGRLLSPNFGHNSSHRGRQLRLVARRLPTVVGVNPGGWGTRRCQAAWSGTVLASVCSGPAASPPPARLAALRLAAIRCLVWRRDRHCISPPLGRPDAVRAWCMRRTARHSGGITTLECYSAPPFVWNEAISGKSLIFQP